MSYPQRIETTWDREALEGRVPVGGVEWEQRDRALAHERAEALRAASVENMSPVMSRVARIDVERVRPAVRSHEVKRFRKTTKTEWFFLVTGALLVVLWLLFLLAVFVAATA